MKDCYLSHHQIQSTFHCSTLSLRCCITSVIHSIQILFDAHNRDCFVQSKYCIKVVLQNFGQIGPPSIILKSDSLYKESTQQSSKVFWIQKAWLDASSHETFRSVIEHPNSTNRLMHNRNERDLFPFVPKHESFCLMQMGNDEPLAKTSGIHKLNNKQWWLINICCKLTH